MAYVNHRPALTPAERRVLEDLQQFGPAVCEIDEQRGYWSWWINGRAVTGPLDRLAAKGKVEIERPEAGAKAFLKVL